MSTTNTPSGSLSIQVNAIQAFTGDTLGSRQGQMALSKSFQCVADLPDIVGMGGFLRAEVVTCSAGDWHLADPADPFQSMGDSTVHEGTPVGKSVKLLAVFSDDANSDTVTLRVPVSNGLAVLNPAGAGYDITPGGAFVFYDPTGAVTGALIRGTNDILTIEISGGSPVVAVLVIYGE